MSQYRTGTIALTNGSNVVTGVGTSWLSQATPNDLLVRTGEGVVYTIAGVSSDTSLTLTANYGGTTGAGLGYVIHRDFIPGGIPLMQRGDVEAADIYNYAITKITALATTMATETQQGIVELASSAEALAGTDTFRASSPARVHEAFKQFGLGGNAGATLDIDSVSKSGFYIVTGATAGTKPGGLTAGSLLHIERGSASQRTQIFDALVGTGLKQGIYARTRRADGVWSGWTSILGIESGQAWQDVSGSRSSGVTYTNSTGKPIQLGITLQSSASANSFTLNIGGVDVASGSSASSVLSFGLNNIIPNGVGYTLTVTGSMSITDWAELR